jgi:hypothetical protein
MKQGIHQLINSNKAQEKARTQAILEEINHPATRPDRRNFLKRTALGGIALTGLVNLTAEETIEGLPPKSAGWRPNRPEDHRYEVYHHQQRDRSDQCQTSSSGSIPTRAFTASVK